ncbi:MerR family transcriptional regulator [Nannocystis sp. RBIL2]|uniref:MerR family transcriptional regulator n=1 Tax=Nannocystis sp. RBIL2 TaxID=2996788 RepID=UPI002270BE50|nr:MerR family transcriptional regulator [Nannocystis sp. RBIL2]
MTQPRRLDPAFATTEDIVRAAGVTRRTVAAWVAQGLLPAPTKVSQGSPGGVFNRFPAWAVERARYIAHRRAAGFTTAEVLAALAERDANQGREGSIPMQQPSAANAPRS